MNPNLWESGASVTPPEPPASPSTGYPTGGNPALGIEPTKGGAYWFYQLSQEIQAILVAAGITPDHTQTNQLAQAIQQLGGGGSSQVGGGGSSQGLFWKPDPQSPAFVKTSNTTISVKAGVVIDVDGTATVFAAETAIAMPALTAGTDYAIWARDDATAVATTDFSNDPPGGGNWRKVGGFHYAPGGNAFMHPSGSAGLNAGGDATPQINPYSIWDLKFRPACPDPRGMALVAGRFWADIYLLNNEHLINGTSKFASTIANTVNLPRVPPTFGGTGVETYVGVSWWSATEIMLSHGKRLPTYEEFNALAYGVLENTRGVSSATNTLQPSFTSGYGVMMATGCWIIWGKDLAGSTGSLATGRGTMDTVSKPLVLGDIYTGGQTSGSRYASGSVYLPDIVNASFTARGVCEHYREFNT